MYKNRYHIEMKITTRLSTAFNKNELKLLEDARIRHNDYFINATRRQTKNKKYISRIGTKRDTIEFDLETEYPVANSKRIGNALRMYAIIAANTDLGIYASNQRLMRAAKVL